MNELWYCTGTVIIMWVGYKLHNVSGYVMCLTECVLFRDERFIYEFIFIVFLKIYEFRN